MGLHPLRYCWRNRKASHLSSVFEQPNEGSLPCVSAWLLCKPGMHPAEIERAGREDVLKMDLGLPSVTSLPQSESANALGERPLDPSTFIVGRFELGCGLSLACNLQRLILRLGTHGENPARGR